MRYVLNGRNVRDVLLSGKKGLSGKQHLTFHLKKEKRHT